MMMMIAIATTMVMLVNYRDVGNDKAAAAAVDHVEDADDDENDPDHAAAM